MRYRNVLLCCLSLLLYAGQTTAQEKAKMERVIVESKKSATVTIEVTSSQDFIMGNNKYVLHIGHAQFDHYEQGQDENNRKLLFTIPKDEYNRLPHGARIYLVYGEVDETQMDTLCQSSNFPCWSLGTYSKK